MVSPFELLTDYSALHGRGGSKLEHWGNHHGKIDKVPDLTSLCHLNPINQTPVIHF